MADNFPNEELEKELYLSIAQANLGTLKNHIERRGRDVNEDIFFIDLDYGDFKVGNKKIHGFPTPLQVALVYENYKIAEYLLKKGADPNVEGEIEFYERGKLCETPKPLEIAQYYDISRDDPGRNFDTPLIGSNRNIIKLLLNKGANANRTWWGFLDDYVDEYFELKDEGVDVAVIDESLANIKFIIENISGEATRLENIFIKAYNRNDEKLIRILLTKRRNINIDIVAEKLNFSKCMNREDFDKYCDEKVDGEVIDPITLAPLSIKKAVLLPGSGDNEEERKRRGKCYDREVLLEWVDENPINPTTREPISNDWIRKNLMKPCIALDNQNIREIAALDSEFDRALSDSTNSIINTLDTPGAGSLRDILSTRGNFGNYGGKKKRKSLKKKRKTKRRKSLKKKQRKTKRKSRK